MNYTAMTPAQRNALVAKKVMGWTAQPCDLVSREELEMIYYDSGYGECPCCFASGHVSDFNHGTIPPPMYSEDMNMAWNALKHAVLGNPAHLADCSILISELLQRPPGALEDINVYILLGMLCAWTPDMLCKAILKAYGVEIEL